METRIATENAVRKINTYYVTNGYAKTTTQAYMRLGKELLEYLDQAGLEGSETNLQDWLTLKMRQFAGHYPPIKKYHHYVNLVIMVLKTNSIEATPSYFLHRIAKKPSTHLWQPPSAKGLHKAIQETIGCLRLVEAPICNESAAVILQCE